jgi:hypothetical protein
MTEQEQTDMFNAALKDATSDIVKRMISVAGESAIGGDADEAIIKRARTGLREFAKGAKLIRTAIADELSNL